LDSILPLPGLNCGKMPYVAATWLSCRLDCLLAAILPMMILHFPNLLAPDVDDFNNLIGSFISTDTRVAKF